MSYISREAVMQKFADHVKRSNNSDFAPVPTWNQAVQIVEDFPAADVRPVVKAHWIKCNRGAGYKCSVCKARSSCADVLNGNHKFCYKCGAMMCDDALNYARDDVKTEES